MNPPRILRLQVILNPAAGQDEAVLPTLNRVFREADIEWDVSLTHERGDARRLAREAVEAGAELVAAYGGDGTVMETASGLIGSDVPLGILPGGTANVMAIELGVPRELEAAARLVLAPDVERRALDVGRVGEEHFLLRLGTGFEAVVIEGAERELKDRMGTLAYILSAIKALREPPQTTYRLLLDDESVQIEGMSCLVANSGNLGLPGLALHPKIDVSDGLLDVVVIRQVDFDTLISLAASVAGVENVPESLPHWQVRRVRIESDPVQDVQADGEMIGETPIEVEVVPQALQVVVPARQEAE